MSKNFTIFQPGFDRSAFSKDVGLIPIVFQKHLGYNCSFLCNSIDVTYDELIEAKAQVIFIKSDETILSSLENTDILMLYGIYDYNLKMITKYKTINPDGRIYLKLDMNIHWLKGIRMDQQLIDLLNKCTLISVECRTLEKYIKEHWPVKVEYIPNGYYNFKDSSVDYDDKENTIITIGSQGSYQKATEILLEAFKCASPKINDWKLKLIGSIEESFKPFIEGFFNTNPNLTNKIIFTDEITDRKLLEDEYEKAKIFCLPSRFEGFLNVFPESAIKGCYIISSDIDPAYDITNNKKYGSIFTINNSEELAKILINVCSDDSLLKQVSKDIQKYAKDNFNWVDLCERIDYFLNMPVALRELLPHVLQRVVMESPASVLDLSRYPIAHALLSNENLNNSKANLIIDRIEFETDNTASLYRNNYRNIYREDFFDTIDKLPHYDVILLSDRLEHFTKQDGFLLVDKLLQHTNKKLIITTPKSSKNIFTSRWSFIDFYKYNFSCTTVKVKDAESFMFSFYPGCTKVNTLDTMYDNFKSLHAVPSEDRRKLNIAYILPHKSTTGGLKVLIKQMKLLKSHGHTITGILRGNYTGSIFPDTNKIDIDKELIIGSNDKIDDYLKGYDVIVTGFINDWVMIGNAKLPVILFEQGYETLFGEYRTDDCYKEKNNKSYFDNEYSSRQSLIMSVSSVLSEILNYRYGRLADVIPNGIDKSLYHPISKGECNITKILLIGSPYLDLKGFALALEVLKRLKDLSINIEVTWICQARPYFEVPVNINYIVNPKEELLAEIIRENDILLSTSWYESFSLPPLEAMASGVAVVSTDNGGIRTYGKDGYNCLLVEPGDINGLLTSLISLILDQNKRDLLILNGLKTASEFNTENMFKLLESTLYNVSNFYKNLS